MTTRPLVWPRFSSRASSCHPLPAAAAGLSRRLSCPSLARSRAPHSRCLCGVSGDVHMSSALHTISQSVSHVVFPQVSLTVARLSCWCAHQVMSLRMLPLPFHSISLTAVTRIHAATDGKNVHLGCPRRHPIPTQPNAIHLYCSKRGGLLDCVGSYGREYGMDRKGMLLASSMYSLARCWHICLEFTP